MTPMRRDFDPAEVAALDVYRLLTSLILPRPIAWVSTTSATGVDNVAPHSLFTVASSDPAVVQFTSVGHKDSLRNALDTGEFVVNFAPEELLRQVNESATDFDPHEDEFSLVGIEREPSAKVRPPRVSDSPACIECTLYDTLEIGNSVVVLGKVVHIAVSERVLVEGRPSIHELRPLARLGGRQWSKMGEILEVDRIRRSEWESPE